MLTVVRKFLWDDFVGLVRVLADENLLTERVFDCSYIIRKCCRWSHVLLLFTVLVPLESFCRDFFSRQGIPQLCTRFVVGTGAHVEGEEEGPFRNRARVRARVRYVFRTRTRSRTRNRCFPHTLDNLRNKLFIFPLCVLPIENAVALVLEADAPKRILGSEAVHAVEQVATAIEQVVAEVAVVDVVANHRAVVATFDIDPELVDVVTRLGAHLELRTVGSLFGVAAVVAFEAVTGAKQLIAPTVLAHLILDTFVRMLLLQSFESLQECL